jgi:hypothetical protein
MIPKMENGFRKRSCPNERVEPDGGSPSRSTVLNVLRAFRAAEKLNEAEA